MATPITMPQLGESVTEGVISRWLKAEGDRVERDEPLAEIITDKVNAEMPSPVAGTLLKIVAAEGATVPVGGEIAQIEVAAAVPAGVAAPPDAPAGVAAPPDVSDAAAALASEPEPGAPTSIAPSGGANGASDDSGERRRYSPLVKRLAQEHHVDLSQVAGTGLSGRVTKDDVLSFISGSQGAPAAIPAQAAPPAAPAMPAPSPAPVTAPPPPPLSDMVASQAPPRPAVSAADEEYLPLTPMRRAIAEHMVRSKHTSPHATTVVELDMTHLVRWREANKEAVRARHGVDITYVPIVIQAVVEALKAFPVMNSSWGDDKIILKRRINIGVAVALEDGLVVPVIHDADEKSVVGLARAVADLAGRARANKLALADMQGGTFTVNNVGVFGAVMSTPVINQPQAAILAMNAIVKRPVVVDDAIAIRSMMNLCMSFDHRIVDGLSSGRFMQRVVQHIKAFDPSTL